MKFFSFLLLVIFSSYTAAQSKVADPISLYGTSAQHTGITLSPNGKYLALRHKTTDTERLIVLDRKTNTPISYIDLSTIDGNSFYFASDDTIIIQSYEDRRYANREYTVSSAIAFKFKTHEKFHLMTPGKGVSEYNLSVGRIISISKDGKHAYMVTNRSYERLGLYKVKLTRKSKPKLIAQGTEDTRRFIMNDNGELIARIRFDDYKNVFKIDAKRSKGWQTIFEKQTELYPFSVMGVTPEFDHLVILEDSAKTRRSSYFTMSLKTGEISEPIFNYPDRDIGGVISDKNGVVTGVRFSGFTPTYEFFDEKQTAKVAMVQKALPSQSVAYYGSRVDNKLMLFFASGGEHAGAYFVLENNKLNFLIDSHSHITDDYIHTVTQTEYKARDGLTIPALVTWPNVENKKNLPAIMMPHGGPESYDRLGYHYRAQYFAYKGYVVVQPQFRGSDGFGLDHKLAGRGKWGREMQDDVSDGLLHFAKQGVIDPDRVCIVGGSYGGYSALAGAVFSPELYKCVVSINGVSDVERMLAADKRMFGKRHWVVSYWTKVLSGGEFSETHLHDISPINFIDNIKAPLLLIHGEKDLTVPVKQSRLMYKAMQEKGKDVTYVEIEGAGHSTYPTKTRTAVLAAIDSFLTKHMNQ